MSSIPELLSAAKPADPASSEDIAALEESFGRRFPDDFKEFLLQSDGIEGPIGEHGYIALWGVKEIEELNEAYDVEHLYPGVVLIGGDGGNEAYAIDYRSDGVGYVEFPLIGGLSDGSHLSSTFCGFLSELDRRAACRDEEIDL